MVIKIIRTKLILKEKIWINYVNLKNYYGIVKKLILSKTEGKSDDEIREINKSICYKFDEILKTYKEILNEGI